MWSHTRCSKGATENPFLKRMSEAPSDGKQQYEGLVALIKTASVEGPPTDRYQNVHRLGEQGACRLVAQALRTFPHERCIQLLGFEAIEALAAHSEPNRNDLEKVRQAAVANPSSTSACTLPPMLMRSIVYARK